MQIRLVCADARKDKMAPKREQHRPVAVLEACKHMRRAGRRMAELVLPRAGFFGFVLFFLADTITCRIRTGHPQDTLLLTDNTEIILGKYYTPPQNPQS